MNTPFINRPPGWLLVITTCLVSLYLPGIAQNGQGDSYILENNAVKVWLARDKPSVERYLVKKSNSTLSGNIRGLGPGVFYYRGGEQVVSNWTDVRYSASSSSRGALTYHVVVTYRETPAVQFDLIYSLTDDGLKIRYDQVKEQENFYLIYILLPDLVTVAQDERDAHMAIPADAGRLIDIPTTSVHEVEYEIDWLHPVLSGMAYQANAIGVIDTKSIENHTVARVFEHGGKKYGSFSMKLMHRPDGI
jgi:hypothetical protein